MRPEGTSMQKLGIGLIVLLMASSALADKKAPGTSPVSPDATAGLGHFDRNTVLTGVSIIDGLTGAWTIVELISGRSSGLVNGLTIISAGPAVAFGAAVLRQDANDPAMWTATLAAGAIFTLAAIDIVRRHLGPGEHDRATAQNMFLVPRIEPSPGAKGARVGLALAGTF